MKALIAIAIFATLSLPAFGAAPTLSPKLPIKKTNTKAIYDYIKADIMKSEAGRGVTTDVYEPTCKVNKISSGPTEPDMEEDTMIEVLACTTNFSSSDRWNGSDSSVFLIEGENLTKVLYQSGDGSF